MGLLVVKTPIMIKPDCFWNQKKKNNVRKEYAAGA
jgi:hypothetical protein